MRLTIFTPTYNRKDKLFRVYESLTQQTAFDFEWLIIDDGSSDNTKDAVDNFLKEKKFAVNYYRQENGGKHRAYNKALELAKGEYFFCLDSDDWLANNAIENLLKATENICDKQFIVAYKTDQNGKLLSDIFPENARNISLQQLTCEFNCGGEFSLIFPTVLAKQFLFPTFKGETFITESVVYDRISEAATVYLLPEVITVCEYQDEGLSNNLNRIMRNNPAGYCLYFMQRIDMQTKLKDRLIIAGKYHSFCIFAGKKKSKYNGNYKLQVALFTPIGILFLLYYKFFRGF